MATFEEEIQADPSVCQRCDKRKCTCWHGCGHGRIVAAPSGKANRVAMKMLFRDYWKPGSPRAP